MDIIEQNKHLLWNCDSWECILIKIIKGKFIFIMLFMNINIHLPLMIFIRMHSQESQFHNKFLFCSIMSIIYVHLCPIASFVRAFGKQIQKRDLVQSDETFKKLYYRLKKLVKLSIESIFRMFLS